MRDVAADGRPRLVERFPDFVHEPRLKAELALSLKHWKLVRSITLLEAVQIPARSLEPVHRSVGSREYQHRFPLGTGSRPPCCGTDWHGPASLNALSGAPTHEREHI